MSLAAGGGGRLAASWCAPRPTSPHRCGTLCRCLLALRSVTSFAVSSSTSGRPWWTSPGHGGEQARRAGVTPFTVMATLGALIERGEDHRQVWDLLGVDAPSEPPRISEVDLYPDALACLAAAQHAGLRVGIAGNQPIGAELQLRQAGFTADLVASSATWGVSKPSAGFFERIQAEMSLEAHTILYVGDRLDNDILPARAAGFRTAFLRRGPWGNLHARRDDIALADVHLWSLDDLRRMLEASS